jgi:transcriptional regulator with XRE-family HTH domain
MTRVQDGNLMKTRSLIGLAIPVKRALHKLGGDIRDARRRRRIPMALLAERARVSRTTLTKVEKGDPGTSMGVYATVLFVLGMTERLADVADPRHDSVGLALEEERLPQRIRIPRSRRPKAAE